MQAVLQGDKERLRELRRIRGLGAVEQRKALRAVLKTLSAKAEPHERRIELCSGLEQEREALVGSDSESHAGLEFQGSLSA